MSEYERVMAEMEAEGTIFSPQVREALDALGKMVDEFPLEKHGLAWKAIGGLLKEAIEEREASEA